MLKFLLKIGVCLALLGASLYSYLSLQAEVTKLKVDIPSLEKEVRRIQEENRRLSYEIDRFENPTHLIELAHKPEFSHLKHPLLKEILTVPEAIAASE